MSRFEPPGSVLLAIDPAASEAQIRARVEAELAAELTRRDRTRIHVEDQLWVYELVGRVVGEEQRRAVPTGSRQQSDELWRRIFAAVTPLGPLAEHLAKHPEASVRDFHADLVRFFDSLPAESAEQRGCRDISC